MTNSYGWHVMYVKSKHERRVHEGFQQKGLESFLPLVATERQWSDRKKIIHKPLFPGYVFVNITSNFDFHNALAIESACAYVRFGSEYGRVTEKELTQMRLLVGGKDVTNVEINVETPNIGDILKIERGDLSGLECEVYRVDNKEKISVWIHSMKQNISATIPYNYFQKNTTSYLQL